MLHPPDVSDESWFNIVWTAAGLFFGGVMLAIGRGWRGFKNPNEMERPQGYVLERAELASLGELPRHMRELGPKLETIMTIDQGNRVILDGNRVFLEKNNELMMRMVTILDRIEAQGILQSRRDDREETLRAAREEAARILREVSKG